MTSRERILAAINFKEPDKVPVDWGMVTVSGIHHVAYRNLLKYLGKEEEIIISDPVQGLALPSDDILDMLGADSRTIWANPPSNWKYDPDPEGNWYDEHGVFFEKNEYYCDFRKYPLANAVTLDDLKAFKLNDPEDAARFAGLREKAKNLYENTDYAIVGGNTVAIYFIAWSLRGYENFMADTAFDEKFSNYLMDMIVDWWKAFMDKYLKEIGEYIQIMWSGDDWGSQTGPLIGPDDFRKNVVPRFRDIIRFMKDRCDAKVAYHSCGSVMWCMDDFIDMGVDIIQPLQANAKDMDPRVIKEKYHGKLVLHGGLNNQGVFHLDKDSVIDDCKEKLSIYGPGGGYLYATGHNIQANCPPENIMAIFDTCKKYGSYPIQVS